MMMVVGNAVAAPANTGDKRNYALAGIATQSSDYAGKTAERAIDGRTDQITTQIQSHIRIKIAKPGGRLIFVKAKFGRNKNIFPKRLLRDKKQQFQYLSF